MSGLDRVGWAVEEWQGRWQTSGSPALTPTAAALPCAVQAGPPYSVHFALALVDAQLENQGWDANLATCTQWVLDALMESKAQVAEHQLNEDTTSDLQEAIRGCRAQAAAACLRCCLDQYLKLAVRASGPGHGWWVRLSQTGTQPSASLRSRRATPAGCCAV